VIHFNSWPFEDESALLPPPDLPAGPSGWLTVPLTAAEAARKRRALQKYESQMRMMDWFLMTFARRNELFSRPPAFRVVLPIARNPCAAFAEPAPARAAEARAAPRRSPRADPLRARPAAERDERAVAARVVHVSHSRRAAAYRHRVRDHRVAHGKAVAIRSDWRGGRSAARLLGGDDARSGSRLRSGSPDAERQPRIISRSSRAAKTPRLRHLGSRGHSQHRSRYRHRTVRRLCRRLVDRPGGSPASRAVAVGRG